MGLAQDEHILMRVGLGCFVYRRFLNNQGTATVSCLLFLFAATSTSTLTPWLITRSEIVDKFVSDWRLQGFDMFFGVNEVAKVSQGGTVSRFNLISKERVEVVTEPWGV